MAYCQKCGSELKEGQSFCENCGVSCSTIAGAPEPQQVVVTIATQPQQTVEMSSSDKKLRLIAFVFALLSTIGFGVLILPLIWMIPMTVICWGIYKGTRQNTVAFGVCCILFLNFITGVLLLCSSKDV